MDPLRAIYELHRPDTTNVESVLCIWTSTDGECYMCHASDPLAIIADSNSEKFHVHPNLGLFCPTCVEDGSWRPWPCETQEIVDVHWRGQC